MLSLYISCIQSINFFLKVCVSLFSPPLPFQLSIYSPFALLFFWIISFCDLLAIHLSLTLHEFLLIPGLHPQARKSPELWVLALLFNMAVIPLVLSILSLSIEE